MAAYNRRADGQRPPHRGRTDSDSDPVFGELPDEETTPVGQRLSLREAPDRQRQRGRARLPVEQQNES